MITLYDEEGEVISLAKWTHKIVCQRCKGTGKHVNPSIDGHGISGDDECWDDEDFREMYFGGGYDVTCEECHGKNVVDELDLDALQADNPALFTQYINWEAEYYDMLQMERMERMMGA